MQLELIVFAGCCFQWHHSCDIYHKHVRFIFGSDK